MHQAACTCSFWTDISCVQVRIVVEHVKPRITHLATRWTLPYEDSELLIPLKNPDTFTYPELQVMCETCS